MRGCGCSGGLGAMAVTINACDYAAAGGWYDNQGMFHPLSQAQIDSCLSQGNIMAPAGSFVGEVAAAAQSFGQDLTGGIGPSLDVGLNLPTFSFPSINWALILALLGGALVLSGALTHDDKRKP